MATLKSLFRCEAAGRDNNEDNGKIIHLGGNKGDLLVVCDGMGGMEAGEVASALAVATIEEWFIPERISATILNNPTAYMMQAIVGADTNIKDYTKKDPKTAGMGSTVVMAWVIGQKVYVAWCGDSRAYRFNPKLGLERLSHDHSLVQTWVDAGQITEDQAFDHPQSNIITRSLGDPNGVAMPEAAEYDVYNGDIILLCSDGLCGTLRDREIESIMGRTDDLSQCCDMLWQADEAAGWHDNVTTAMAQVLEGGAVLAVAQAQPIDNGIEVLPSDEKPAKQATPFTAAKYMKLVYTCIALLALLAVVLVVRKCKPDKAPQSLENLEPSRDTVIVHQSEEQNKDTTAQENESVMETTTNDSEGPATTEQATIDNPQNGSSHATMPDNDDDEDDDDDEEDKKGDKKDEKNSGTNMNLDNLRNPPTKARHSGQQPSTN